MKEILIGDQTAIQFAGLVFFALMGIALSLLIQTTKRDITSMNTPYSFSWSFLFSDNAKRIAASCILVYLSLRFTKDIFNVEINNFFAACIGLSFDRLAQFLKDKTNILGK